MHLAHPAARGLVWTLTSILIACGADTERKDHSLKEEKAGQGTALFERLSNELTGISFANVVEENEDQNYYTYEYLYNGGGVALGDIDNDGLTDIYLTGNLVPDKLYLNEGDLRFRDITTEAITTGGDGWHSGVVMADVNGDGLLDIYVCRAGWYADPEKRRNLLYINNGDRTFREEAARWGVDDTTRSTHAAFFDMDRDGDLDLFVLNTPIQSKVQLSNRDIARLIAERRSPTDRLFRNDGDHFEDITSEAGIWNMGYGLGVAIADLDDDGWPDIHVSNDYVERDFLYMNQGDGTFRDEALNRYRHISNFGMGCDAADLNNDGLMDLIELDMVSADHVRSKKNMGSMDPDKFRNMVAAGLHHQYMINTLQLNRGDGQFSEVGQLAGVARTDWSWAPLFADLDNDGLKDLLVTNGYKRDMRDNDYMITARAYAESGTPVRREQMLALVPTTRIRDHLFVNRGDLHFEDVSEAWGFDRAINSNGAAYGDLDGDGDLDLVINHIDEPVSVLRNLAMEQGRGHALRILLEDLPGFTSTGSRVEVVTPDGLTRTLYKMPSRGFQSSVDPVLHAGLGAQTTADVHVQWPDGRWTTVRHAAPGLLRISPDGAERRPPPATRGVLFTEAAEDRHLSHRHVENAYDDFAREVLLPHRQSENGPLVATSDVDGNGTMDLFIGGARGGPGRLFLQTRDGHFRPAEHQPWEDHQDREDLGSLFFDADGDGDADLFVASGSNETDLFYDKYVSRIYFNDGHGRFEHMPGALPETQTSAMRATAGDVDSDGDLDLFIGGRVIPGRYPLPPRSYLMLNDGTGRFSDVTTERAPGLEYPGLVTDCEFLDLESDGDLDLVIVGEWMPLTVFSNQDGRFVNTTQDLGLADTEGWWWSLTQADLDSDGDMDLLCGNLGSNSKFQGTKEHPIHLYWNDFDGNGSGDIVLAKEHHGELVPVRGRECSSQQCPMILDRFPTYDAFAHAALNDIYGVEGLAQALHLKATFMKSCVLWNEGDGELTLQELPVLAQIAPVNGFAVADWNEDGHPDVFLAGNHWGAEVETVRYDAGLGLLLLGDGKHGFQVIDAPWSGIRARGNVKDVAALPLADGRGTAVVIANNNGPLQLFVPSSTSWKAAR